MKKERLKRWLIGLSLLVLIPYIGLSYIVPLFMPMPEGLVNPGDPSTVVTDEDGKPLRRFLVNEEEVVSAFASLEEIPDNLVHATISAEDKRFYSHLGVDVLGVGRAGLFLGRDEIHRDSAEPRDSFSGCCRYRGKGARTAPSRRTTWAAHWVGTTTRSW